MKGSKHGPAFFLGDSESPCITWCVMMMLSFKRSTKLLQSDQQRFSTLLKTMRRFSMLNAMVVEASFEMHKQQLGGRPNPHVTTMEQPAISKWNASSNF